MSVLGEFFEKARLDLSRKTKEFWKIKNLFKILTTFAGKYEKEKSACYYVFSGVFTETKNRKQTNELRKKVNLQLWYMVSCKRKEARSS